MSNNEVMEYLKEFRTSTEKSNLDLTVVSLQQEMSQ